MYRPNTMYLPHTLKQQARQARLMRNAQCLRSIQYGINSRFPGEPSDLEEAQPQESPLEMIFIERRVEHLNRVRQYRKIESFRQSLLSMATPA